MRGWRAAAVLALSLAGPARAAEPPPVERLLDALKAAPSAAAAEALEGEIKTLWRRSVSPAARLLVERCEIARVRGARDAAAADCDAAVTLEPERAEVWFQRAALTFDNNDNAGAIGDLASVLRLQPRYFPAFDMLSRIAERRGDFPAALEAWQHLLAVDPMTPPGQTRLRSLRERASAKPL
jgi:tetratricopeptide (TPR) repeat protein